MKFYDKLVVVPPSAHIMDRFEMMTSAQQIELCGRICYKSEDKITPSSSKKFSTGMVENKHNSALEMAPVTLLVTVEFDNYRDSAFSVHPFPIRKLFEIIPKYLIIDKLSRCTYLVSGTIRSFRELVMRHPECEIGWIFVDNLRNTGLFDDIVTPKTDVPISACVDRLSIEQIDDLSDSLHLYHRHVAVKFIVNRAISHEIVRHRPCSYLQESQRYCRYGSGRFGDRVTYIKPMFFLENSNAYKLWEKAMLDTEQIYLTLINEKNENGKNKYTAQAARTVLPNSCKTELIMLANLVEWEHFFCLRCGMPAEPSMREVTIPLRDEFRRKFPQHSFNRRMPEGWMKK